MDKNTIKSIVSLHIHGKIISISLIYQGINSYIYRIRTGNHKDFKVKYYPKKRYDHHDSITTEYNSLTFLWNSGIRNINRPIAIDKRNRLAIYSYIHGQPIPASTVGKNRVDDLINFIYTLGKLSNKRDAIKLPLGKEACFTMSEHLLNCDKKLVSIKAGSRQKRFFHILERFLKEEFVPIYRAIYSYIKNEYSENNMDLDERIPPGQYILNPSDFGFHNCLGVKNRLYFTDFEYFGWDDPAKMIIDLLQRPRGGIPNKYHRYFYSKMIKFFSTDRSLSERIPYLYLIIACKWCLIILNIWTHEENEKNQKICMLQLAKARKKLGEIKAVYLTKNYHFID
jgi:hypothetical protein